MEDKLTIGIPTYNRRSQLIKTIDEISKLDNFSDVLIVISDNCSNYSVEETINERFSSDILSHIRIYRNRHNIGSGANIASLFNLIETKWFWMMGDDDVVADNAITKIYNLIERHPDACHLKFIPVYGRSESPEEEYIASTLEELVEVYKSNHITCDSAVFMSNNVYNMQLIGPYVMYANMYAYTCAVFWQPTFQLLNHQRAKVIFSNQQIIQYQAPDGDHWSFSRVCLGLRTLYDLPLNISKKTKQTLVDMLAKDISNLHLAYECIHKTPAYYGKYVYDTFYSAVYCRRYWKDKIIRILFYLDYYCHTCFIDYIYKKTFGK